MKLSELKELIKTSMLEVAPKKSDKMSPKGDSDKLSPKDRKTLDDYEKENRGQLRTPSVVHGGITMREGYDIPDDIEWDVDDVVGDIDGYTVELALRGYSPSTGKYYTAGTDGVDAGGGDYDYSTTDLYGIEEVPDNTSMTEETSKSAAILNRPSNRMTFEQMGMIMMLADELGGEENAKANEFLSGTASKMEAGKYIQELIAKIDGEEDVLAEAEKIVAAWAEKQTLKEEMHGGYLELLEMNPAFDEGVGKLLEAWNEWKEGPMTEPEMVEEAKHDILAYLASILK